MKYIIIKFFPSNKIDYLSHYFFNFFFALVFIINIPFLNSLLFFSNKPTYILLIPTLDESFEENKDLIFSRLSVNEKIISIKKIEKKFILEKLNKKLDAELIMEDLIPEAFEILIKKNYYLDVKKENKNITEIIKGAEIIETIIKDKHEPLKSFLIIIASIIFFLGFLAILQTNYLKKIKLFLIKCRVFGAKDRDIVFNISLGYFLFQLLGILSGYFSIYLLATQDKGISLLFLKNIEAILIFNLIQNISCVLSLVYNLKYQLRKVL